MMFEKVLFLTEIEVQMNKSQSKLPQVSKEAANVLIEPYV